MRDQYPIPALCGELEVSPRGYYDWSQRQTSPGPRAVGNQLLAARITERHKKSRETYGRPGRCWRGRLILRPIACLSIWGSVRLRRCKRSPVKWRAKIFRFDRRIRFG